METTNLLLLLLLLLNLFLFGNPTGATSGKSVTAYFIHNSCITTRYPNICEKTLSDYYSGTFTHYSPRRIAYIALSVSLIHTKTAYGFVNRSVVSTLDSHDRGVMRDCVEELRRCGYHLSKSIRQMEKMGSAKNPAFAYRLGNVQTWASAALTDVTTCVGGLENSGLNDEMKIKFDEVTKVTANALALINRINVPAFD